MTNDAREAAKARVAKLMAMAGHERSNEHEADAALRMAAKLMRLHNIEQAEVLAASGKAVSYEWATVLVPADPKRPMATEPLWLGRLALSIARFTDTIARWASHSEYGKCIRFQGEATDVEYAVWLCKRLRDVVRAESGRLRQGRSAAASFRFGMTSRLGERMKELKAAGDAELAEAVTSAGTALAIVETKKAMRDEQFGPQLHRRRTARVRDNDAREAGRAAGDRVNFNRPLAGTAQRAIGSKS